MSTARVLRPFAICMTGISGSGKTTLANAVSERLKEQGVFIDVIDGDETREMIGNIFGHGKEERLKMGRVNQAIGWYLLRNNISFILSVVAPYEKIRAQFRDFFGSAYIQLYIKASVESCAARDVKGLYKLSYEKRLENLNGSNDNFEVPVNSDLIIDTDETDVGKGCEAVIAFLHKSGYLAYL